MNDAKTLEARVQIRRLYPDPADSVDAHDAYALPAEADDLSDATRHLRVNMVSSADGAATVDGRVGVLTGAADQKLLHLLRALSDVVLVGAGTVRAEGYGPIALPEDEQRRRTQAGQAPNPRLAMLTRSLELDLTAPVFTEATARPLVITVASAPVDRRAAAEGVAEVVVAGDAVVDLRTAVEALVTRGMPRILSEGGPTVLAELFANDLVDELCLAVAPVVTCGEELRITSGPALSSPAQLELTQLLEQDQYLFMRYGRR